MILARFFGGLGNQLFIFAYSLALWREAKKDILLDTETGFIKDYTYNRKYSLQYYEIPFGVSRNRSLLFRKILPYLKYILYIFDKFSNRKIYYIDDNKVSTVEKNENMLANTVQLNGYLQSYTYFDRHYDKLQEYLSLKTEYKEIIDKLFNNIVNNKTSSLNQELVCIHIRTYREVPEHQASSNLMVDKFYYEKAIKKISKLSDGNLLFLVFSDDIELAKSYLDNINCVYVSNNDKQLPAQIKDFEMMRRCDHFVIANSTFSWWAAYLADNTKKQIIRPSDKYYKQHESFYPANWIPV
ncbi:MAG: alpha-1,2-fucosyltransferase [bacterium]|nr:alpha-1,2-fucosyltransferase [bacterium]